MRVEVEVKFLIDVPEEEVCRFEDDVDVLETGYQAATKLLWGISGERLVDYEMGEVFENDDNRL